MPANAVYVGRPTIWGNPFETAEEFRQWMAHVVHAGVSYADFMRLVPQRMTIEERIQKLRGKDLACWCPLDCDCHADVLLELANR